MTHPNWKDIMDYRNAEEARIDREFDAMMTRIIAERTEDRGAYMAMMEAITVLTPWSRREGAKVEAEVQRRWF